MTQTNLIAVDQTLAFPDPSMPQPLVDAWSATTVFAQAAARSRSAGAGFKGYMAGLPGEYPTLGWSLTSWGAVDPAPTTSRVAMIPIRSLLYPHLAQPQQDQIDVFWQGIQQPNATLTALLDFWWSKTSVITAGTDYAIGALTAVDDAPVFAVLYAACTSPMSGFRGLFSAESHPAFTFAQMTLDMNIYHQIAPGLNAEIGTHMQDHIRQI